MPTSIDHHRECMWHYYNDLKLLVEITAAIIEPWRIFLFWRLSQYSYNRYRYPVVQKVTRCDPPAEGEISKGVDPWQRIGALAGEYADVGAALGWRTSHIWQRRHRQN
ncbi:MAG: hypothetical protein GPOALKHO_000201 [Sodalis sp.]|nr:MAG: hypothetical protein GPOALKHO_000201 [Sodalis sp.]